jgi:hypothetical protein
MREELNLTHGLQSAGWPGFDNISQQLNPDLHTT